MKSKFEKLQKNLQKFTERYFKKDCPKIEWKEGLEVVAESDINNREIYLNPKMSLKKGFRAYIFEDKKPYVPKANAFPKGNEKYFAAILHEIGHFKLIEGFKHPKKWKKFKEYFKKSFPEFDEKKEEEDDDEQARLLRDCRSLAGDYFNIKKGEKKEEYQSRIKDVCFWTLKGYPSKEIEVVDWALKEFRKKRNEINEILKQYD